MTAEKASGIIDITTEQKIKDAARAVFHRKGFAATRTRDIASEAGINLALLNYYFRSKAKLFEIIMSETFSRFIKSMLLVLNDESTSLEEKVQDFAARYIDLIIKEPEIPTFILTEIRSNTSSFLEKVPVKQVIETSVFIRQHQQAVLEGKISEPNPLHFLLNLMGMVVFPFIARPLIMKVRNLTEPDFEQLMLERKKLIPMWVKAMYTPE